MALRRKVEAPAPAPAGGNQPAKPQPPTAAAAIGKAVPMTAEETDKVAREACIDAGQPDPGAKPQPEAAQEAPQAPPAASVMEDAPQQSTALARTSDGPSTALGVSLAAASGGAVEGDFESSDFKFPQLKVVQGSGPLSGSFSVGTVILGDDVLSYPPQDLDDKNQFLRLQFIPLKVKKFYRETLSKAEQEAGNMPRIVHSKRELLELGGRVGYGEGLWREGGAHHILIVKPDNLPEKFADSAYFDTYLDDKLFAPAVFYANSGNYGDFTQPIVSATNNLLTEPILGEDGKPLKGDNGFTLRRIVLWKYYWTWTLTRKLAGDYWVWRTPASCQKKPVSEEIARFCAETHVRITGEVDATAE